MTDTPVMVMKLYKLAWKALFPFFINIAGLMLSLYSVNLFPCCNNRLWETDEIVTLSPFLRLEANYLNESATDLQHSTN